MNNPHTITVDYHGQHLSAIDRNGQPWFTAAAVGKQLGYNEANYRQAARNLYLRHRDEFSDADTGEIKLSSPGGTQETRVFSLSGIVLLGFFANTGPAKRFRQWAKAELEARMRQRSEQPVAEASASSNQITIDKDLYIKLLEAKLELAPRAPTAETSVALASSNGRSRAARRRALKQAGAIPAIGWSNNSARHTDDSPLLEIPERQQDTKHRNRRRGASISQVEHDRIVLLHSKGWQRKYIAMHIGCDICTVREHLSFEQGGGR